MDGQLFTQDFLAVGINETGAWHDLDDAKVDSFLVALKRIYHPYSAASQPTSFSMTRHSTSQ